MSNPPVIKDPVREVLKSLTGKEPPEFVKGYNFKNLTDHQIILLQNWCVDNVEPRWACGISLMDAAEIFVAEAVGNANIAEENP